MGGLFDKLARADRATSRRRSSACRTRRPSRSGGAVLYALLALLAALLALGRSSAGSTSSPSPRASSCPQSYLKIVQPAEPASCKEILVREGQAVGRAGADAHGRPDSEADADLETDFHRKRLTLAPHRAELAAGRSRPRGRPAGPVREVQAQYHANRAALGSGAGRGARRAGQGAQRPGGRRAGQGQARRNAAALPRPGRGLREAREGRLRRRR